MKYLFCENCSGYYKLKNDESIEDFISCECGGKLKYYPNKSTKYKRKKIFKLKNTDSKNDVKNLKQSSNLYGIIIICIISVITIFLIFHFDLNNLIMDYSSEISLLLIAILSFRYIFNSPGFKENSILKFLIDRSIFIITPFLIIFLCIVMQNILNLLNS